MNSIAHRLLTSGVLIVWGAVLCAFYFTGRITAYLHPTFQPFALAAGCVLVAFALLTLLAPNLDASCGAGAPRSSVHGVLLALVLVGPLLFAFANSQDSFGASTVANRTYVQDIAQLPAALPPTAADPALPDDGSTTGPGDTASPADQPPEFPKNAAGDLQAQVVDFLYAAQLPDVRSQLEGKPVEVIGQLMPAKSNNPHGDRFDVIRMFMTCCAADAQPLAVSIQPREKSKLAEMTWVKIRGRATFPVISGQRMPLIDEASIEKTDPPEDTYLY
jgi:uncharacterized repeat protein (TIGR03943 family)